MRRRPSRLAAAAALLPLLAACGGGSGSPAEGKPAAERTSPPGTSAGKVTLPAEKPAAPGTPSAPTPSTLPPEGGEVTTTKSGLRYSVLTAGTGTVHPKRGDLVRVHYTGWTQDGKEFDSSRRPGGSPAEFAVGQLIEGWNEALTLMTEGARWRLTVPASIGYGDAGAPPRIPPGATLVFDVELLEVRSVPVFRLPAAGALQTTESGIAWETVTPGTGPALAEGDSCELEYSFWAPDGELLESSVSSGRTLAGLPAEFPLPFLKEIPLLMKAGQEVVLDVPYDLGLGARGGSRLPPGTKSVWRLKLVRVGRPSPAPDFAMPGEEDLKALPGGLRIQVLREGTGEAPAMGQKVVVHYAGWLTDGTLFDASWPRGLPATFRLGEVIPGWNQGLQQMKPGGAAVLVIPPELGYGARGSPPKIPPAATLVFRVELLEVRR